MTSSARMKAVLSCRLSLLGILCVLLALSARLGMAVALTSTQYVKAVPPSLTAFFGYSTALSDDALTLVVGSYGDDVNQGSVDVFRRASREDVFTFAARLEASNGEANDNFGYSLAISGDGSVVVVGAHSEKSSAQGVNPVGGEALNDAANAGAVYVFRRTGPGTYLQEAYVKASNAEEFDYFGFSVSVSMDGTSSWGGRRGHGRERRRVKERRS